MKKRISVFLLYLVYWYFLFVLARVAFLITYFEKTMQLSVSEIISTFIYGFKLDMAIAAYIAILPSLTLTLTSFFKSNFTKYFYHIYTATALFFSSLIILGDLFMYRHWGFRLDATPLFYMTNLKAMTASVSTFTVIEGILGVLIVTGVLFYVYFKLFNKRLASLQKSSKAVLILLPASLLLGIVMRGGLGISSLSTSSAYFSKNQFANHAAINPIWNVGFSITESGDLHKKYVFYSDSEMEKFLAPLKSGNGTTLNLLNTDRPNIILFITESLTAKALEATGGRPGIMPELNKLVKEGVLFNDVYAASDRTDKGMAAVLAGYPSLPGSSPLKYQKLTQKLAFIPQKLKAAGYRNEFFYGGTLVFANYQAFLVQAGFDKMVSDKDFPAADLKSKWGAFDHVVFNKCLADTPDNDTKFFKTILTLTSHEPFETPVPVVFKGDDDDTKYLNSLHYTDASIGNFIKEAKTRKWWKNTLVIIIADHGSARPGNSETWEKSKYHIPMIWLGGALNVQDTVISNMAAQTDVAATLLAQLKIKADDFRFSKNILTSDYIPYSFFTFSGGFGFQKPDDLLIYNTITNTYNEPAPKSDSINEKQGKAYLQSVYTDFYNKNK
ncbi:MAG: sulfatase-like hydrolase/transferase [Lentimicrobiaceae bacterium]